MSERYSIAPQMRDYDQLGVQWVPYTMFAASADYRSASVNTDRYGLRCSDLSGGGSIDTIQEGVGCSLIVGSSTAFGVGATDDTETIASKLSTMTDRIFLNFGCRAFNSRQELFLFLTHAMKLKNIGEVVLVSGVNNLYVSAFNESHYHPMFFSEQYYAAMKRQILSSKRRFLHDTLSLFGATNLDLNSIRLDEIPKLIFTSILGKNSVREGLDINRRSISIDDALHRTTEDLHLWKSLSDSIGFGLIFALQPMPAWCGKSLTNEEVRLFETLSSNSNQVLKQINTVEIYESYRRGVEKFCEEHEVAFVDLNESVRGNENWVFVDRVHLTNLGNSLVAEELAKCLTR